jgi:hypothetical protein
MAFLVALGVVLASEHQQLVRGQKRIERTERYGVNNLEQP